MDSDPSFIEIVLGLGSSAPTWWQMGVRGVTVFVAGIAMVRLASPRILGGTTPFDTLLIVILGAILSRTINGDAPFLETLLTSFGLVALHRLFGVVAFYKHSFGRLIKGDPVTLVQNGRIDWSKMKRYQISEHDLKQALRSEGSVEEVEDVALARLERSGAISVIPKK